MLLSDTCRLSLTARRTFRIDSFPSPSLEPWRSCSRACQRRFRGFAAFVAVQFTPKALTLLEHCTADLVLPNVRANREATAGRQGRAGENVPRTTGPGLVACRGLSG